ncbi:MAG: hypothetical protein IRY99_09875 [Isosphaeraceae bacterium]|nr:hypothetical protein [Isosphaeraceae bacterium]
MGRGWLIFGLLLVLALTFSTAEAGWPRARRSAVAPAAYAAGVPSVPAPSPTPMLGAFYSTPYMMVRGNAPTGGGYSPLGLFTYSVQLSEYGPLSSLRQTAAPVLTYSRGYDGRLYPAAGTAFSNPFLPELNPVVYPTRANVYGGFRESRTPPWWPNGTNWVDQN